MMDDTKYDDMPLTSDERRRYDRQRLIIDVSFDGSDATGVASTQDISAGGLYMNTQTPLPEGAQLMLRLPLPERACVIAGEVVYSNPGRGVGVRFKDISDEDRALIERAISGTER